MLDTFKRLYKDIETDNDEQRLDFEEFVYGEDSADKRMIDQLAIASRMLVQ